MVDQETRQSKTSEGHYNGKRAVVVGSGPGGSMAAMLLAKRGFHVKVFEKRPTPDAIPMEIHRAIPLVLNPDVTKLLEEVGIEIPAEDYKNGIIAFKHINNMNAKGQVRTNQNVNSGKRTATERHCIANAVLKAAISQKVSNLEFFFNSACEDVDVDAKIVRFSNRDGEIEEVPYDLLIGADGVNSRIREALKNSGHLNFHQRASRTKYVSVRNLPMPTDLSDDGLADALSTGVFTFLRLKTKMFKSTPRMVIFYRAGNDLVQMNIIGDTKMFDAIKGKEFEWISETAPSVFPKEWFKPIAEGLQNNARSNIGPVTYCSSYIGPNIALIGDACHSSTPTLGIGANRAILDTRDLNNALGESEGNIQKALQIYDENCRPQVAAIQELELLHGFSQLEGQNPLWVKYFMLYIGFHGIGNRYLPKLIPPPIHFQLSASAITPQAALQRYKTQGYIFGGFITAAACAGIAWGLRTYNALLD